MNIEVRWGYRIGFNQHIDKGVYLPGDPALRGLENMLLSDGHARLTDLPADSGMSAPLDPDALESVVNALIEPIPFTRAVTLTTTADLLTPPPEPAPNGPPAIPVSDPAEILSLGDLMTRNEMLAFMKEQGIATDGANSKAQYEEIIAKYLGDRVLDYEFITAWVESRRAEG